MTEPPAPPSTEVPALSPRSAPPEAWEPLLRLARIASRPLERFLKIQAASGILLLVMAAVALAWANSPFRESYTALWHTPIGLRVGEFAFERSLEWVINDGLMVVFFFVVGLEIRREIHHGELSEWRRAALPSVAALGGMMGPALIYLLIAGAPETHSGWGVPTATDIAFAVGVLTLLGKRVPPALRVLLLALAVIDDLGAIVVIAVFYSDGVQVAGLVTAGGGVALIFAMQALGVRQKPAYIVPGLIVWGGVYAAGVHPTIAGVIIGLVTPVRAWLGPAGFVQAVRAEIDELQRATQGAAPAQMVASLRYVNLARREAMSPTESLVEMLSPWVAFGIMPLFALANAGISLSDVSIEGAGASVALGVGAGLVLGKPIGVVLASMLVLKLGIAKLPAGLGFRHLVVLGVTAGIGFTMALFVAQLAFSDPALLGAAKLGVLASSAAAGLLALAVGALLLRADPSANMARTADEAESSTDL
jgi:Na+:H+ antiporter, NhaA family